MFNIKFKNVGQGDSILLNWLANGTARYGLIDCAKHLGRNPLLDELISLGTPDLDFAILSHLHHDHYSGYGDLLEHYIKHNKRIGYFFYTFNTEIIALLDHLFLSSAQQSDTHKFIQNFLLAKKNKLLQPIIATAENKGVLLYGGVSLSFLSPASEDYVDIAEKKARFKNGLSKSVPDINAMSTIVQIDNSVEGVLLTSDATKKAFKRILNTTPFPVQRLLLAQAAHHGSKHNYHKFFWRKVSKTVQCPAVFSVGDNKRGDNLPNKEVVEAFDQNNYEVFSTNSVFGINEYFQLAPTISNPGMLLAKTFAIRKSITPSSSAPISSKYEGDKQFSLAL